MEVEMDKTYFELDFTKEEDKKPDTIMFRGDILKYFGTFNEAYQSLQYRVFRQDPNFMIEKPLWQYIVDVYREHEDVYDEEGLRTPIALNESKHIKAVQLIDLYRMVRILNFYDIPLMLDFVLDTIIKHLLHLTRKELLLANPRATLLSGEETYNNLATPLEKINRAYNVRVQDMLAIFKTYIGVNELIELIRQSYIMPTTSVLAAGKEYIMVLTQNALFTQGDNQYGQLGLPNEKERRTNEWRAVPIKNVVSVWCGHTHTLILSADGLYACGNNERGQLGIGDTYTSIHTPLLIDLPGILAAACGAHHSLILTRHGVYATGANTYGQLGNGITVPTRTPQPMMFKEAILPIAVACGDEFSLILTKDGVVYGCGLNVEGVLGRDPLQIKQLLSPEVIVMPEANIRIVAISAGARHALFLDKKGRVFGIGDNRHGELGVGDTVSRSEAREVFASYTPLVSVSAGNNHSFFIDEEDDLYATGITPNGQTGLLEDTLLSKRVPNIERVISVVSGDSFSAVVTCDGLFVMGGQFAANRVYEPPERTSIVISEEPICLTFLSSSTVQETSASSGMQCSYCGASSLHQIALHHQTNKLYCVNGCLERYQAFRV